MLISVGYNGSEDQTSKDVLRLEYIPGYEFLASYSVGVIPNYRALSIRSARGRQRRRSTSEREQWVVAGDPGRRRIWNDAHISASSVVCIRYQVFVLSCRVADRCAVMMRMLLETE